MIGPKEKKKWRKAYFMDNSNKPFSFLKKVNDRRDLSLSSSRWLSLSKFNGSLHIKQVLHLSSNFDVAIDTAY